MDKTNIMEIRMNKYIGIAVLMMFLYFIIKSIVKLDISCKYISELKF